MPEQPFRGSEPGADLAERLQWAAFVLASDLEACEALAQGMPVPRHRLHHDHLALLGEPLSGPDLVLTPDLALSLSLRMGNGAPDAATQAEAQAPVFLDAYEFVKRQEQTPPPLWGSEADSILTEGCFALLAGRPGSGKTTFVVDLACHLAAGLPYPPPAPDRERAPKPYPVPRPLRVALIENEGPRELFRDKLRRKLAIFEPNISEVGGYLGIQDWRWGSFSFADNDAFLRVEAELDALQIDLVIGDPLNMLGVEGVGSPSDTRMFLQRLRALGLGTHRAYLLIHHFRERVEHHEDELRKISGAWGGHLDSLITLAQTSQTSQARLGFPKLRWARGELPKPLLLDRVYNIAAFHAVGEEGDFAILEPKLAEALQELRDSKQGVGGLGWSKHEDLARRIEHRKLEVRNCLEAAPHIFALREGDAAKELGARSKLTKLWGLRSWDEAPAEPAEQAQLEAGNDDIPW